MNHVAQVHIGPTFNSPFGLTRNLGDLVSALLFNAFYLAGFVLLLLLIFGGISIMIGAGRSDPESTARGKSAATAALTGFLIVFAAYWIVLIVQRITGLNILNTGF